MQELISKLSYKTHLESRNSTILLFLYFTGLRASELLNLKLDEINFESKYLLINGKGNKQIYVQMSDSLIRVLKLY